MPTPHELFNPVPELESVGGMEGSLRGEEKSRPRVTVRIERRSTRLLDPDNLYGSVKSLVDCLRAAKLIVDDNSQSISLVVSQSKVKTRKEHETVVELDYEI